jgi:hypothetical protein
MFCIVYVAVLFGTLLPQAMNKFHIDPAHASAAIQVSMDIIGISITCVLSTIIFKLFDSRFFGDAVHDESVAGVFEDEFSSIYSSLGNRTHGTTSSVFGQVCAQMAIPPPTATPVIHG